MNAKPIIHVGIALICFGIAALTYQGVTRTSDEIGEVVKQHANTVAQKSPFVPAFVGGLLLVGGVALVVVGAKTGSPP